MAKNSKPKIVFMGTPEFGRTILETLAASDKYEIVGVYTQPDKMAGRGMKLSQSEVKKFALAHDLPLFQPSNFKNPQDLENLKNLQPDFIIVAAYGLLLPQAVLDIAPSINVHASLLPEYRGAAPIQRAIMDKWQENGFSGVSIMKIVRAMDAGPVYAQAKVDIHNSDYGEAERNLAQAGAHALIQVLDNIDFIIPVQQEDNLATYAKKVDKSESDLDLKLTIQQIDAQIRALNQWPGIILPIKFAESGKEFKVRLLPGKIVPPLTAAEIGTVYIQKNHIYLVAKNGWYELDKVIPQGKRAMPAHDFIIGQTKIKNGECGRIVK